MQEEQEVEIKWLGFELHPEIPPGGQPLDALLGKGRTDGFFQYMKQFATGFGVEINVPTHIPNTRRALAMTEYARDNGKLEAFRDATMEAHWLKGKDIESNTDLQALAEYAGLDPDIALSAACDAVFLNRIDAIKKEAKQNNITSIPTFVLGDAKLAGCQPYDKLAKMIAQHTAP